MASRGGVSVGAGREVAGTYAGTKLAEPVLRMVRERLGLAAAVTA